MYKKKTIKLKTKQFQQRRRHVQVASEFTNYLTL